MRNRWIFFISVLVFCVPDLGRSSVISFSGPGTKDSLIVIPVQDNTEQKTLTTAQKAKSDKLDSLFQQLLAAKDERVAGELEAQIWGLWLRSGDDKSDQMMNQAIEAMNAGSFDKSLGILNELVSHAPNHSEAWNKRATVYYLLHRYDESLADIAKVLSLEPRHFGAISGIALISLARGDKKAALNAYRRAIVIYPLMPGAAAIIHELEQEVEGVKL